MMDLAKWSSYTDSYNHPVIMLC